MKQRLHRSSLKNKTIIFLGSTRVDPWKWSVHDRYIVSWLVSPVWKDVPNLLSTRGEIFPPLLVGAEMPGLVGSLVKFFLSNIDPSTKLQQSRFSHLEICILDCKGQKKPMKNQDLSLRKGWNISVGNKTLPTQNFSGGHSLVFQGIILSIAKVFISFIYKALFQDPIMNFDLLEVVGTNIFSAFPPVGWYVSTLECNHMIHAFPHLFLLNTNKGVHNVHVSSEKSTWLFRFYRGHYTI